MRDPLVELERIATAPGKFNFYAALRLLECSYPRRPRLGQSSRPQDDAVRFTQNVSLAFESAMVAGLDWGQADTPTLSVNFFGLSGANGPLPLHLSEYVRDRLRNANDPTLAAFFDLFHHRMISLLYRAWASAQPTVALDRPKDDRFSAYVGSFAGWSGKLPANTDSVPLNAKLHFAGRLSGQVRHAEGLAGMLTDFFKTPCAIKQFVGHWMDLPDDGLCAFAAGPLAPVLAPVLGQSTVLGRRVWDCQSKFRIVIGPLRIETARAFLPGGARAKQLRDWVRNYVGLALIWDVQLLIAQAELPRLILGKQAQLGWTSWLSSRAPQQDDAQLCFSL